MFWTFGTASLLQNIPSNRYVYKFLHASPQSHIEEVFVDSIFRNSVNIY